MVEGSEAKAEEEFPGASLGPEPEALLDRAQLLEGVRLDANADTLAIGVGGIVAVGVASRREQPRRDLRGGASFAAGRLLVGDLRASQPLHSGEQGAEQGDQQGEYLIQFGWRQEGLWR